MMTLAQSKRASELQKDMNAWEENRLMTSGECRVLGLGRVRAGQTLTVGMRHAWLDRTTSCFAHPHPQFHPPTLPPAPRNCRRGAGTRGGHRLRQRL